MRTMPGRYQTAGAVLGAMSDIVVYKRPDDYVRTMKSRIDALEDADVQAAAREVIHPDRMTWVIVGDLSKIEKPIRDLGLGPVEVIDADGNPVRR